MRWAASIALFLCFGLLKGQGSTAAKLQSQFRTAISQGQPSQARSAFHRLYAVDSLSAAQLEPDLHGLVYDVEAPSQSAIDTMLRIYRIGLAHFPSQKNHWLDSRAVFGYRWRERIPLAGAWLLEALEAAPIASDASLIDMWSEAAVDAWQDKSLDLPALISAWGRADRILYMREIASENAAAPLAYRIELRSRILNLVGGCPALSKTRWPDEGAYLQASALCPVSLPPYTRKFPDPSQIDPAWSIRLQANQALNNGDADAFLQLLSQATAYENEALLLADLHCQRALLLQNKRDFKAARAQLQAASKAAPEWGKPYLLLAALYAYAAQECEWGEFDRKAVYWLAMDVALEGRNKSEGFDTALNEAYTDYASRMPSSEEASFRGLRPGDTWPIKCWINAVTTAKEL